MKKLIIFLFITVAVAVAISGCSIKSSPTGESAGVDTGANQKINPSCIEAAGYDWCESKQKCLRSYEERCPGSLLPEPDFNKQFLVFNEAYKNVLFSSGQKNEKDSKDAIISSKNAWQKIDDNFSSDEFRPAGYANTENWAEKIKNISILLRTSESLINENKFEEAHKNLEKIRADLRQIRAENNIVILSDQLLAFHDSMEEFITAELTEKGIEEVEESEAETKSREDMLLDLNEKLLPILNWQELKDNAEYKKLSEDVSQILKNIEESEEFDEEYKKELNKLKSAFIKLYLIFG